MNYKKLLRSKTVQTGLGAIASAGVTYYLGEATLVQSLQLAFTGALSIFLWLKIEKK
jgi:hypothetical protein